MTQHTDMQEAVAQRLGNRLGDLRAIARETRLSYDTVLRVKNLSGNPSYSAVRKLAKHLGVTVRAWA